MGAIGRVGKEVPAPRGVVLLISSLPLPESAEYRLPLPSKARPRGKKPAGRVTKGLTTPAELTWTMLWLPLETYIGNVTAARAGTQSAAIAPSRNGKTRRPH